MPLTLCLTTLDDIHDLMQRRGGEQYSGEPVTQLQHALQAATRAEAEGADDELITAALLHDLGHLVHDLGDTPTLRGIDDVHQYAALGLLRRLFAQRVLDAVRLHVDAKRWLCAQRPGYHAALSADSQRSLVLQGGDFDESQSRAFLAQPHAADAVRVREWDDLSKLADVATPTLTHFMRVAERCRLAGR